MKFKAIAIAVCMIFSGSFADLINVTQNATVSLTGNFFTEYLDWSTSAADGSPQSQALINSIIDGNFLTEGTQWDQNSLWWDEHGQDQAEVTITLDKMYEISSFKVQADNNDSYQISYMNDATQEWMAIVPYGAWGMITRPDINLNESITTSQLKIVATGGDKWYSLSEVQAWGVAASVPEPGALSSLLLRLLHLSTTVIRRKK